MPGNNARFRYATYPRSLLPGVLCNKSNKSFAIKRAGSPLAEAFLSFQFFRRVSLPPRMALYMPVARRNKSVLNF